MKIVDFFPNFRWLFQTILCARGFYPSATIYCNFKLNFYCSFKLTFSLTANQTLPSMSHDLKLGSNNKKKWKRGEYAGVAIRPGVYWSEPLGVFISVWAELFDMNANKWIYKKSPPFFNKSAFLYCFCKYCFGSCSFVIVVVVVGYLFVAGSF